MTHTRADLIRQKQQRIKYLQGRIAFHSETLQKLIDEAAHEQAEIDLLLETQGEDAARVSGAVVDEGQD